MTHVANPAFNQSLYVILIGANNYIFHVNDDPVSIVNNISASMEKLISVGAHYFIVPTLPDISYTPFVSSQGKDAQEAMRSKVSLHNQLLTAALVQIKIKYPFINLLTPDVDAFLNDVIATPSKFGVINVTDKCDTGLPLGSYNTATFCDRPKDYLFWDFVHPTTKVHCEMAQDIMEQLSLSPDYKDHVAPYQKDYRQCDLSYVNKR